MKAIEITATPIPADSAIGLGRELTRALERLQTEGNMEDLEVNETELREIIREEIQTTNSGSQQREGAFSSDERALLDRAGAVGSECLCQTMDLILSGRTKECDRFISDAIIKGADAKDTGGDNDDGTKRKTTTTKKEDQPVTSFRDISDDDFCRAFQSELNPFFD